MRHFFTFSVLVLILALSITLSAQQASSFTGKSDITGEQSFVRSGPADFVPGEILVKFKDDVVVSSGNSLKSIGINSVDRVLKSSGVTSLEKLFPAEKRLKSVQIVKDPQGREMKIPSLHNIYKITVPEFKSSGSNPIDIFKFIEDLKSLPEVEYAEPNYIFSVDDLNPVGLVLTSADVLKLLDQSPESSLGGITPNDPMYSQQWYIPAVKADLVWAQSTGDTSQIIAILDTGIDWLHPDLMNKIWRNKSEIPDNGKDDDGNGLIDDIRGWDFINDDNNPADDNSHGTHVAGIAAAETDNHTGIAGINWKARIMPIKVFQASGRGDVATITKGIIYASRKGATVINMSFGSTARSLAMEDALANAYQQSILVAAAGNDGIDIESRIPPGRFYPAALSYVLGVTAPDGEFSNTDKNGPVFSTYPELSNYEIKAPGTTILSTVPNGNYREYQGTSMAAPIVSGIVSLYRMLRPTESQELLFGNLINSTNTFVDIQKALTLTPSPQLNIVTYQVSDSLDGDMDGQADVGETLDFRVKVRNTWGLAADVSVGISYGEFTDPSNAQLITSQSTVGSISAYATKSNTIPLRIKLAGNMVDGKEICFVLKTWYGNHLGETSQPICITVENGVELKGIISSNITLYPSKKYIISDNLALAEGATMIIKPGTTLKLSENKSFVVAGNLIAVGKPDSLIVFTKRDLFNSWGSLMVVSTGKINMDYGYISYCNGFSFNVDYTNYRQCMIKNTTFTDNYGPISGFNALNLNKCVVKNTLSYRGCFTGLHPNDSILNTNITNNKDAAAISSYYQPVLLNNCLFGNTSGINEINYITESSQFAITKFLPNYYGTSNIDNINKTFIDFEEDASKPLIDLTDKLNAPPIKNHGIVWKVVVNGKDAQDQFSQLEPLGVGKQKFKIYFNRAMDSKFPPLVSMGVRYPYSQTPIAEQGSWNPDTTVYSVYCTVGINTGDGINTMRVSGARDREQFEIPIEDRRFRVVVNAAGSASNQFMATAGLGKIKLEWNNAKLADGLGFNMYRMEKLNDTVLTVPKLINSMLIADTLYTDFAVTPNKKYYYYYKIVRTNLSETDSSKIVSTMPLTASKGDANGDLAVNVLDITTLVSYLLNQNPQPFIFEAADMNNDKTINVLDVIGAVNKITGSGKKSVASNINIPPAYIYLDKNEISFKTQYPVSALQFELEGNGIDKITLSSKQKGFELVYSAKEGKITGILFSFDNKSLPTEPSGIISLKGDCSGLKWGNLLGGDAKGNPVKVIPDELHTVSLADCDFSAYPNPFNQSTTISYNLSEASYVQLEVYDIYGKLVQILFSANQSEGMHQQIWKGSNGSGSICGQGVYFCRFTAKSVSGNTLSKTTKLLWIGQ